MLGNKKNVLRIELQLFATEKTEPATPRRRQEARKKGQVAKSGEISTVALIIGGFVLIRYLGPFVFQRIGNLVSHLLAYGYDWEPSIMGTMDLFYLIIKECFLAIAPIFGGLFIISLLSQVVQVGFMFTSDSISPKLSRINPIEGIKRIFSKRALIELLKACFKIFVVGYFAYTRIRSSLVWLSGLSQLEPVNGVLLIGQTIFSLVIWVGVALLIIAVFDYLYQRLEFERSIRMSKQDIKEEFKETEGEPQIRARIRQRQREISSRRMMEAIPRADVVITNPTHYAVAISYVAGEMAAPQVVAKGAGLIAKRIKEIAKEHNVVMIENAPLARTLYKTTNIGQEIPVDLYPAVAEVLAYVYRTKRGFQG
ncbi:MAG: flagellar biosynthesis protein FlhB [Firmicutes bacterium]|nr:flagellar biosynthesis protein FlhB [Bacillota bacterium]